MSSSVLTCTNIIEHYIACVLTSPSLKSNSKPTCILRYLTEGDNDRLNVTHPTGYNNATWTSTLLLYYDLILS